jgi:hypothetical protein
MKAGDKDDSNLYFIINGNLELVTEKEDFKKKGKILWETYSVYYIYSKLDL